MNKFQQITSYYKKCLESKPLQQLLQDQERNKKMIIENDEYMIDLQREKIDQKILDNFQELFESQIKPKIQKMYDGDNINVTEKQAALHYVLRCSDMSKHANETVKKVWSEQQEGLKKMKQFSDKVRNSEFVNFDNQKFTDVISVGIGGSSLGTECIYRALKHNPQYAKNDKNLNVHFLSNVDPASFVNITSGLNPKTTLVVMISKSFTTAETIQNGNLVKNWIIESYQSQQNKGDIVAKHFVAISANIDRCKEFGITSDNVYPMWNQVGGRFSVSSAVGGLPVSLAFSFEVFQQFLQGMEKSDMNFFKEESVLKNTACLMSLIDSFHNYTQQFQTKIIIPYSEGLKRFPAHIQQVEMESIGKSYNIETNKLNDYFVGQFVFGEPGTNSQHSFFQSLHQARVSSIEFIGFSKPQISDLEINGKNCYNEFMANMFAQADAFALGKQNKNSLWENFDGNRPSMIMLFKDELNAFNLGYLISLYENRCAASGFFADINTFDQYGVNLGKVLAKQISPTLLSKQNEKPDQKDGLSKELIQYFNKNRY